MKKERIIVTGGSGSLGRSLIPKLVSKDFDCISISRKSDRIESVNNIKCDITNFQKVNSEFSKSEFVFFVFHFQKNLQTPTDIFSAKIIRCT